MTLISQMKSGGSEKSDGFTCPRLHNQQWTELRTQAACPQGPCYARLCLFPHDGFLMVWPTLLFLLTSPSIYSWLRPRGKKGSDKMKRKLDMKYKNIGLRLRLQHSLSPREAREYLFSSKNSLLKSLLRVTVKITLQITLLYKLHCYSTIAV